MYLDTPWSPMNAWTVYENIHIDTNRLLENFYLFEQNIFFIHHWNHFLDFYSEPETFCLFHDIVMVVLRKKSPGGDFPVQFNLNTAYMKSLFPSHGHNN